MKNYKDVDVIKYEPKSKEPFAFKYYNPEEIIEGKSMKDQLRFALSYWHTINASGTDMFGEDTMDKSFGLSGMAMYEKKADFAFELMKKLGIEFYCFHDVDIAPGDKDPKVFKKNFETMVSYLYQKQDGTNIHPLWVTVNMFSEPVFMAGASTSPNAEVFARAALKVKCGLDAAKKLGAEGYVFWGGREGYDTLLNTDMGLEIDNLARFMHMAVDYAHKIGFKGQFYIEPKPKEPTKHQYDFDVATCCNFLRKYGLEKDFKMNIEANHATLAGHTFQHEIRTAAINGVFGSIDSNQGDLFLGWDTDQFPTDVYNTTLAMYEILKAGGFTTGGLNFDAKARRQSNTFEDILLSYIAGMDAFALGLRKADAIKKDGRIDEFVENRYSSYTKGLGKSIVEGKEDFDSLAAHALEKADVKVDSGHQEYLESVLNEILFKD
ncbi:MAG: xylose isomerase [Bacilli bacterium]|jgi:xylose isomerase|nr:xylose isomerase [Bacilli bacterium]MCI2055454.1 xylose isomerase [Bacilli bacterium]